MREVTINRVFYYALLGLLVIFTMVMLGLSLWNMLAPEEFCWMSQRHAVSCVIVGGAFSFILGMILGREQDWL